MQSDTILQLSKQGPVTVTVNGDCMAGCAPHGARLSVEPVRLLWPGDVVVFRRSDQRWVSHRFLGYIPQRSGIAAMSQADNHCDADALIPLHNIIGRVYAINGEKLGVGFRARAAALFKFLKGSRILAKSLFSKRS